uniref:SEC24 homolog C, COPII coat complex component n=1 Tax=Mus musculus TaxID=10090 RepID=A0A286YDN4_MOUSE
MNVNQSAPPVPPYGQNQPIYPGYHQSSYGGQPGPAAPATPYGAYNGPVPGYQQAPPQGSLVLSSLVLHWPLWSASQLCFSPMALPPQVHR